ncbi:hypothetical protein CERSUDRAFT_110379 [Gelatoporia subvermispora B]|uniref:Uncharacterized protein n=1 Tax=Ceriporiopsis subvermispora (strain B) TaxID=914234 RepID=M2QXG2_CERS8|nr:hypothetical protein CERSUDRAFT_110379 [Gelatoporia subvermispora B]
MEDPDTIERQAALKKQRYLDGRTADEGHNTAFAEMDEQPDVTDGPRILSRAEFTNRPTMPSEYAAQSSSNFGRGILKPTSPITTFPYWGEGFTEPSDLTISPKLGPSYYIQVHETETRPFLDPVTDWRLPPPREDVANIDHLRDQIARSRKSPHGRQSEGDRRPTDLRLCVGFAPRTRPARDFLTDGLSSTRDPDMGGTSPGQETRTLNRAVLVEESSDSEDEAVVEAMLRCDEAETACSISPLDDLQDRVRSWMRSVRGRRPH